MFNGGSQFWEWFTDRVADKVAIDANTRVLQELKELCKNNNLNALFLCKYCELPTDKYCRGCYNGCCRRTYYCHQVKFTCDICENCNRCHRKCHICQKSGTFEAEIDDHKLIYFEKNIYCRFHFYELKKI
jgi:hypothetical protein